MPRLDPLLILTLALLTLLTAAPALAQEPDASACPIDGRLAGTWVSEDGISALRFSADDEGDGWTFAKVQDDVLEQVSPVVACEAGSVEICYFGRRHRMDLTWKGQHGDGPLTVHFRTGDVRTTYRRAPGEADGLFDPRPLGLPDASALPEERVAAIRKELAERHETDQGVRQDPIDPKEMMRVDQGNTEYLKKLVGEVGWIDPGRFGDEAANTAFLIVQHSQDVPLMMAALPNLKEQGRLQEYALLFDRLQLRLGEPQRYGSQIGWAEDGSKGLLPIESLEGIDERRAEVDLGPLDEYLQHFDLEERRVLDCR